MLEKEREKEKKNEKGKQVKEVRVCVERDDRKTERETERFLKKQKDIKRETEKEGRHLHTDSLTDK